MPQDELAAEIDAQIAHQVRWRRIMSGAYFTTAAMGIVASTAATIVAGLGHSSTAALLAGGATVAFGLEKALLFREKWTHHLNNAMQLKALKLRYLHGGMDPFAVTEQLASILTTYAEQLPISPRADANSSRSDPDAP